MPAHVAILHKPYMDKILSGEKTIECRLTRTARAPYRRITAGDVIHFKQASGPYRAVASAKAVAFHDGLTAGKIAALRSRHNQAIGGDDAYWLAKRQARYATLITLDAVTPTDQGPTMPPSRGPAWFVIDNPPGPDRFDIRVTAGAIRNRYLTIPRARIPDHSPAPPVAPGSSIELVLPDGRLVRTEITGRRMIRWRGWGRYFDDHSLRPGDSASFVHLGGDRYRVGFTPTRRR